MTETLDTSPESVRRAAAALADMEGFEDGLRRRTEGTMWMIWGLVFAGILMSYWAMSLISPPGTADAADVLPDRGLVTPWIGWVIAGGLATTALWRGAALKREGETRGDAGLRHVGALATIMAGVWILFIGSWFLPAALTQYVYAGGPLVILGISTWIVVSTPLVRLTALGRRVARTVALVQIGSALIVGQLLAHGIIAALPTAAELAAAITVGGTWLVAGLYQSTRG